MTPRPVPDLPVPVAASTHPDAAPNLTEPFTEFDARRVGRFRRYFAEHPVVVDWIVIAWFVVPGILSTLVVAPAGPWSTLVFVVAGGVALRWRRRAPVAVAIVIGALACGALAVTHDTAGYELAIALTLYAVAAARGPVILWTVFAGLMLAFDTAVMLWLQIATVDTGGIQIESSTGGITTARVSTLVSVAVIGLIAIAIGTSVRARRQHIADLVDRANAIARDRDRQAELAAATERARIAREMHDVVAHSLTVMVALADGAKIAGATDPALAGHALDELTATGRAALADMRRVLGVLRDPDGPAALTPSDATTSFEEIVERFRTAGLPVRLIRAGSLTAPPHLLHAAHRIVQEALTNVLRYAPLAPAVTVAVARRDDRPSDGGDWLDLRVTNTAGPAALDSAERRRISAQSVDGPVGTGRGIIGMRERAALYGGHVTAGPTADGWEVLATLRLETEERNATS